MRGLWRLGLLLGLIFAVSPARANEIEVRGAMMEQIHQRILARDFHALDAMEQAYRSERSRTKSGVWNLDVFYNGMFFLGKRAPSPDCSDSADAFLADWRRASPKSPAPFIASADRLLDTAWCFRGSGYSDSVADDAWAPFNDNLAAAQQMLDEHKSIAAKDPQFYRVMASIYVAEGRSDAEFKGLLAEAMEREAYYYPLYEEAFRYYEPQWFGDYAQETALVRLAVSHTRAKDQASAAARIYWNVVECGCMPAVELLDADLVRQGMRDLVSLYPEPWNVAHMAKIACAMNDGPLARHYFDLLGPDDDGRLGWSTFHGVDTAGLSSCHAMAASKVGQL